MRKIFLLLCLIFFGFIGTAKAQTVVGFDGTYIYWNNNSGTLQKTAIVAVAPSAAPVAPAVPAVSSFDQILAGINLNALLIGGSLGPTSNGVVSANNAVGNLASQIAPNQNTISLSPACGMQSNCIQINDNLIQINDATIVNGSAIITSAGQAHWNCPGGNYPCSVGGDVGDYLYGFYGCGASLIIAGQGPAIGATATTIITVNSPTSVVASSVATQSSVAGSGCIIYGLADDAGFAALTTAIANSSTCSVVELPAGNMLWTAWHFQNDKPSSCLRQSGPGGATYLGTGLKIMGKGKGASNIYLAPWIGNKDCNFGTSPVKSCMFMSPNEEWAHFAFQGGGNGTVPNITTQTLLIEANAYTQFTDVAGFNFGSLNPHIQGGVYDNETYTGFGGVPVYCRDSEWDGWGYTNFYITGGLLQSDNCSYQDSSAPNGSSVYLNSVSGARFLSHHDTFMGVGTSPVGQVFVRVSGSSGGAVMTDDTCWTNTNTAIIFTCVRVDVGASIHVSGLNCICQSPANGVGTANSIGIQTGIGGTAFVSNSIFKMGNAGTWLNNAGTYYNLGGNQVISSTGLVNTGTIIADGHSVKGTCTGVATASQTLGLYGTGPNVTATTCTSTTIGNGSVVSGARTLDGLTVTATVGGVNVSSGVVTVLKNGSATALTCTIGTSTFCSDGTHTVAAVDGDLISIQFTTQSAETLAGVNAFVEWN